MGLPKWRHELIKLVMLIIECQSVENNAFNEFVSWWYYDRGRVMLVTAFSVVDAVH